MNHLNQGYSDAFVPFAYYWKMGMIRCGPRLFKINGNELNEMLFKEINNALFVHVSQGYRHGENFIRSITIRKASHHNQLGWSLPNHPNPVMVNMVTHIHVVSFTDVSEMTKLRRIQRAVRTWIKMKRILSFVMAFHVRLGEKSLVGQILNQDNAQEICKRI